MFFPVGDQDVDISAWNEPEELTDHDPASLSDIDDVEVCSLAVIMSFCMPVMLFLKALLNKSVLHAPATPLFTWKSISAI